MTNNLNYTPDDGYTEPGYIKPVIGLHGEFRFRFRPMLTEEYSHLIAASDEMSGQAYDRKAADMMLGKLTEWNLSDGKGVLVPITQKTILRLKVALFNKLYKIITGTDATDIDPLWSDDITDTKADEEYESALSDRTPGEVREENDAKN